MARYLHYYKNQADHDEEYQGLEYTEPWVSYVKGGNKEISYDRTNYDELRKMPLTFEILEDGIVYINYDGPTNDYTRQMFWKINGGEEHHGEADNQDSILIHVEEGDKVEFYGYENFMGYYDGSSYEYYTYFTTDCEFNIKGNIMSLFDGDDFADMTEFPDPDVVGVLSHVFYNTDNLKDAYDLLLPARTLTEHCYESMFYQSSLVRAPEFPSNVVVGNYSCRYMYYYCFNLKTAPVLPSKTLGEYCYFYMFYRCGSITTAPELPAEVLSEGCYSYMFAGCTGLTIAPELKATYLPSFCYDSMFSQCSNLNYIKCLASSKQTNSTTNWVYGVSASGTFVRYGKTSWTNGDSGIPNNWTIINA